MEEITVEERKKILLSIMDSIDSFCTMNNIRYYLGYGSLLGAVRHKGFIPWDDDIDITMPRPDLSRFLKTYESEEFAITDYKDKRYFPLNFSKVYAKNTCGILNETINLNYGVAVDIFPLDGLPEEKDTFTRYYKKYVYRNKKYMRCLYYEEITEIKTIKNIVQRLYKKLFNTRKQAAKLEKLVTSYNFDETEIIGNIFATYSLKKYEKEKYLPSADYHFENRVYKGPEDYDYVLSVQYGKDYMIPPSADKRESLHSEKYYWCK